MKRILAVALLFALAACGDTPTEVPLERQNARGGHTDDASSGSITWMFEADVYQAGGDVAVIGASTIVGWITFTFTTEDEYSWWCYDWRDVRASVTYVVDGEVTVTKSGNGRMRFYCETYHNGWINFYLDHPDGTRSELRFDTSADEFPSGLPVLQNNYYSNTFWYQREYDGEEYVGYFRLDRFYMYAPPESS
ncbi:MAG: hypothetical protein R3324_15760, partial [Halobacteriales archaeon]|nr:hypothetical protein [Halobacteriales archaeon]